jgi:hypothetical protein
VSRRRFGAACVLGLPLVVLAGIVPVEAASPVQVSESPEISWASTGAAAGTGSSLYVAYVAPADAGYGPVRLRRSKDGGATFLPSILVSDVGTTDNHSASVAAAGSSVHVLWIVGSGAAERAWLRTSRDGGATWSPSAPVTPGDMSLGEPGVFASGERVFVTYTDLVSHRVLLRRSTNRGTTFAPPLDIGASRVAVRATMAFSKGVMYIAWAGTEGKVRVRRSTTGGTTWNSSVAMQTPPDGGSSSTEPWLATAGHHVMLVGRSAYLIFSWASQTTAGTGGVRGT